MAAARKGGDPTISLAIEAHAIIMGIAFLILMPLGALSIRVLRNPKTIWIHASCQMLGLAFSILGMIVGIWLALRIHKLHTVHASIGLALVAIVTLQPLSGYIHHLLYKNRGPGRRVPSWIHVLFGRTMLLIGAVDGGLGIQLAWDGPAKSVVGAMAWGWLSGLTFTLYVGTLLYTHAANQRRTKKQQRKAVADMENQVERVQ